MNESQQRFRERLLSAEKSLPTGKYRNEMAELQERKLTPLRRTVVAVEGVIALAAAIFMGWMASRPSIHLPVLAKAGLGFGAVCSLLAGGLAARTAKRGVMKRKADPPLIAGIVFVNLAVFSALMIGLMDQVADAAKRVEIGSSALLFFGVGCMFLITSKIEQMELRTREKLLEIELQMQQLAEEMRSSAGSRQ